MSDIGLFIDSEGFIDLRFSYGDLEADEGLQTAVLISLFSDAKVDPSEVPEDLQSVRGWWGDLYPDVQSDKIGSKLWLLERLKTTDETLLFYEDYAKEALQWLIDDGVADSTDISAEYNEDKQLILSIKINQGTLENKFSIFWDGQKLKLVEA